jgi:hypothetical protein
MRTIHSHWFNVLQAPCACLVVPAQDPQAHPTSPGDLVFIDNATDSIEQSLIKLRWHIATSRFIFGQPGKPISRPKDREAVAPKLLFG